MSSTWGILGHDRQIPYNILTLCCLGLPFFVGGNMRLTKRRKIEIHLLEEGHITSWEAIEQYGVTRLSAVIYNLKHDGWTFETEMIPFTDRYGDTGHYAKYTLKHAGRQTQK
jgi:hypothetical protein